MPDHFAVALDQLERALAALEIGGAAAQVHAAADAALAKLAADQERFLAAADAAFDSALSQLSANSSSEARAKPSRGSPSRDSVLSVSAAADALPWRRSVAFAWLRDSGLIVAGPEGRDCIRWADVLDALGGDPDSVRSPPPRKRRSAHRRPDSDDPWKRLPAVDLSGRR